MSGAATFLTRFLTRALSLQDVEGAATQTLFVQLDSQLDASLLALETAATPEAFTAAQKQYASVFSTFGDDGAKLDAEFRSEGNVFGFARRAMGGHGAEASQADLGAFDRELFATAKDFGSLGVDIKNLGTMPSQAGLMETIVSLAGDSASLAGDFAALSKQAATLHADLAGGRSGALAGAMAPLAGNYAALSNDFGEMLALCGGASSSASGAAMTFGSVFKSIDSDLIALDNSMHALAGPMANAMMGSNGRCG